MNYRDLWGTTPTTLSWPPGDPSSTTIALGPDVTLTTRARPDGTAVEASSALPWRLELQAPDGSEVAVLIAGGSE